MSEVEVQAAEPVDTASTPEPIAKAGGDGATSFDELETIKNLETKAKNDSPKKSEPKPESKAKPKDKDLDKDGDEEEAVQDPDEGTKKLEPAKPAAPILKAKVGDKEIDLQIDTKIPVRIDGQMAEVELKDLVKNFSGLNAVQKRFDEFSQVKQSFERDKQEIESFISDVFVQMKDNPFGGLILAAERAGLDPVKYQVALLEQMNQVSEQWGQMTPEQKKLYEMDLKNKQLERKTETYQSKEAEQRELQTMDQTIRSIETELGLERKDFASAFHHLAATFEKNGIDTDVTPELVKDFILDQRRVYTARGILSEMNPAWADNVQLVEKLVEIQYRYPEWAAEDVAEVAKQALMEKGPQKQVADKLKKSRPEVVTAARAKNPASEPISFDALDRY